MKTLTMWLIEYKKFPGRYYPYNEKKPYLYATRSDARLECTHNIFNGKVVKAVVNIQG